MQSQNSRMDCCSVGNKNNCGNDRPCRSVKTPLFNGSGSVWITAIAVAVLLSAVPAFGQFMVQPMKLNVTARPGRMIKVPLNIQSSDPNTVLTIDFFPVELTQWEDATWRTIDPNITDPNDPDFGFDISKLSSCREWISMDRKTLEIAPLGMDTIMLTLRVPRRIRGIYAAGIVASLKARPDAVGIAVTLQYVIPVLIEMQSRPMRHKVEYSDVGLESIESSGEYPATTLVSVSVANNGGTYSSVKALTRLRGFSDGHWREITETEFPLVGIMPGSALKLRSNIQRPLPRGKYRINGVLYVDGRRSKVFGKEIDFAGHPTATKVTGDASLILNPSEVSMSSMPGATRTAVLKVFNASDEAINVQASLELPRRLIGVTFGNVKGTDLNCAEWVNIKPDKFSLRSGAQQSILISATMPNPAATHPCYYAVLRLQSTYADGENAGATTAYICVENNEVVARPVAYAQKLTLAAAGGPSNYLVVARFGNFGSIHFTPKCRVALTTGTGVPRMRKLLTSSKENLMLPFEARDFSEIFDFSTIPVGTYRLIAALEYAPGEMATRQIAIRVSVRDKERFVEIIQLEEELEEKIEIQW